MKNKQYYAQLKRFKKLSADLQFLMQNKIFNQKRFRLITEIKALFQSLRFYFAPRRLKRILGLCGLLFVLETGTVNAQNFKFEGSGEINPYNMDLSPIIPDSAGLVVPITSFADMDDDGDVDMISIAFTYDYGEEPEMSFFFHENIGTTLPDFSAEPVALKFNEDYPDLLAFYFVPCDIDGDGDLDLLSLGLESLDSGKMSLVFVENTGTKDNPILEEISFDSFERPEGILYHAYMDLKDIDDDGDLDIVSIFSEEGTYDDMIGVLENTGTATEPAFANAPIQLTIPTGNYMDGIVQALDIDDDGDLDLVYHDAGILEVAYNNGDMTFGALTDVTADLGLPEGFNTNYSGEMSFYAIFTTFTDLDLDGDLDVLAPGVISEGEESIPGILFHENLSFAVGQEEAIFHSKAITLFPNPCVNQLQITLDQTLLEDLSTKAGIYDVQGRLIQEICIDQNHQSVDVSDLSAGWYQIRLTNTNRQITQSFIKK